MSQVQVNVSQRQPPSLVTPAALDKPVTVFPLPPDGPPLVANRIEGRCQAMTLEGVQLELFCESLDSMAVLLCMPDPDGRAAYAAIEVDEFTDTAPGRWEVRGHFGGVVQEIISAGVVFARFCSDRMQFVYDFAPELLLGLVRAGVLRRTLEDVVQLCPKCQSMPSLRKGCRGCGSIQVKSDRLIHHFACAYVGPVAEYETSTGLVCPKCRTNRLVVGSDFEYLVGPYRCRYCQQTDTELEQVGQCLRCRFRFPMHQAINQELIRYYAHRLDPLDFIAPS